MTPSNSILFMKLHLHNYGPFLGSHDFLFDQRRTFIVGPYGTGKTTIMSAPAHLGPAQGVTPCSGTDPSEISVRVSTWGNRSLVKRYSNLIFLGGKFPEKLINKQETILADGRNNQHRKMIIDEAWHSFQALMPRKVKVNKYKDLNPALMSRSEVVCFAYAFAFAVRKVMNLDLPVVLDSPYAMLDSTLRHRIQAFLRQQPYQQILLVRESQFEKEDGTCYTLDRAG